MKKRAACWITGVAIALPLLLIAGCPTSSEGIDLTERGELAMAIRRVSESATATATAQVSDNNILSFPYTEIVLADDQVLYINNVPLTATTGTTFGLDAAVAATVEAADAPDTYTISFDNEGTITTCEVTPPLDFDEVTPESGDEVERDGFELEWDPSDDATITISITGWVWSYTSEGTLEVVEYTVSLADLADDGDITIGSGNLASFLAGDITVALTRVKTISQKLGFSSGTIQMAISRAISLTLIESSDETG